MNWPPGYPLHSRNMPFTPLMYMVMGGQFHSLMDAYKEPVVPHAKQLQKYSAMIMRMIKTMMH